MPSSDPALVLRCAGGWILARLMGLLLAECLKTKRPSELLAPSDGCRAHTQTFVAFHFLLIWTSSLAGVAYCGKIRMVPQVPLVNFTVPGDLNIGVVLSLHEYNATLLCSDAVRELGVLQRLEAIVFAVQEINQRDDILPNITIGFTIVDDCSNELTALARSLHFIQKPSAVSVGGVGGREETFPAIDCVAVIAAESSSNTIQIADMLSVFQVPQLSYASSSPLLDDKNKYDFFVRTVPSDTMQAQAIVAILEAFQWRYVSVLYSEGSYGSEGFKAIQKNLDRVGYCTAVTAEIKNDFADSDYDSVVKKLMEKEQASVVVLFTMEAHAKRVFAALKRRNLTDVFTWVGGDSIGMNRHAFDATDVIASGMLSVNFVSAPVPRFQQAFQNMTLAQGDRNPWFREFFAFVFDCDPAATSGNKSCDRNLPIMNAKAYEPESTTSMSMDAVYTLARALDAVTRNCSNLTSPAAVRSCFSPTQLRDALLAVRFQGESVNVSFDKDGNLQGSYDIRNLYLVDGDLTQSSVGKWDIATQSFRDFHQDKVQWKGSGGTVPSSVCSQPCRAGFRVVTTQPSCCWYCEACRDNERTVNDTPRCQVCPTTSSFTWPDEETRTMCLPIPPTYVSLIRLEGKLLTVCDLAVFFVTCAIGGLYIKNRQSRLIKASSRELSLMMLGGHVFTCLLLVTFVVEPTVETCVLSIAAFHLSFTCSYSPLLVKTNRIYRIFMPGKTPTRKPLFIGSRAQVAIAVILITLQLLLMSVWMGLDTPSPATVMPSLSKRFVEKMCSVPQVGFLLSLTFNLSLMAACGVHAVKTRRLPTNFNEAKFITFSVYTTVLLWLSFLPTYFIADSNVVKTLSLAFAMLFNVISCQVFLFLPKLYAVYFLAEKDLNVRENRTTNPSSDAPREQQ